MIIQAHLENGTYEQIVSLPEKELELNGFKAPDELQINIVTQQATTKSRKTRTNLSPLQKANLPSKPVPLTQMRKRLGPKQHEQCHSTTHGNNPTN